MKSRLFFVLLAFTAACGTAVTAPDDGETDVTTLDVSGDTSVLDTSSDVTADASDTDAESDADPADVTVGSANGTVCEDDSDCLSFLCLPLAGSEISLCSNFCATDQDCVGGFECVLLPGTGSDRNSACLADDFCLDEDEDGYGIGPGCEGADCDDTLTTVHVNAPELCNGDDDDCDGEIDDNIVSSGDACDSGSAGVCGPGVQSCVGGAWSCVENTAPTAERCNLIDDDCDGFVDENDADEPLARDCYSGPAGTQDVGACVAGLETCADGSYTTCTGQVTPIAELCNGIDDDCDGVVDNNNPESGGACVSDLPGACAPGRYECVDGARTCVSLSGAGGEICNGIDDDCDGTVDEGADSLPLSRTCYTGSEGTAGVGVCSAGTQVCEGGSFGICNGQVLPQAEACDGLNNDCDADGADEGNPGAGLACDSGNLGICAAGTTVCADGGIDCVSNATPSEEICNGQDDDCDGTVDEAISGGPLSRSCYTGSAVTAGVGECAPGTQVCQSGVFSTCEGQTLPSVETCDGRNNDCDADGADEGNPGAGLACSTGESGRCSAGTTTCASGANQCVRNNDPIAETCNGIDDNCNGSTDEAAGGGPLLQACYSGAAGTAGVGRCREGARTCSGASYGACSGQIIQRAETCDGTDDDCDGRSDEGCPTTTRLSGTTSSAQYGGGGGAAFSDYCSGRVIIGFQGQYSGSRLLRMRAVCGTVSLVESTSTNPYRYTITRSGAQAYTTNRGTESGSTYSYQCPTGQVVTGIRGREGGNIDAFGYSCSALNINGSPGSYTVTHGSGSSSAQYGGNGGDPFSFTCPSGQVANSVFGRYGSRIDAIGIRCTSVVVNVR